MEHYDIISSIILIRKFHTNLYRSHHLSFDYSSLNIYPTWRGHWDLTWGQACHCHQDTRKLQLFQIYQYNQGDLEGGRNRNRHCKDIEPLCLHGDPFLSYLPSQHSCGVETSHSLFAVTYWIMHALTNLNLKHKILC